MEPRPLVLAPLALDHADAMLRWMLDPQVAQNLGLRSVPTEEKTRAFIARAATDDTIEARAILRDGVHVGNVVLDSIDRHLGKANLHIYVGEPAARGGGIGKQAVRAMLGVAFDELGLAKVCLTVHARNARAIAAYVAVGFQVEGVHRGEFLLDGERLAAIYMGCFATDLTPAR